MYPEVKHPGLDTYREDLEDVNTGDVQFFILVVCGKRHRYVTEVLREQCDQDCGPVRDKRENSG